MIIFLWEAGFATFGTATSGKYYSKAYSVYGLSNRWGFTKDNYSYIGDGGWASIIGQFGYLGTLVIIFMLYNMIKSVNKRKKKNVPYICLFAYAIIASTNEVFFSSAYSILFSIIFAILLKYDYNKNEEEIND